MRPMQRLMKHHGLILKFATAKRTFCLIQEIKFISRAYCPLFPDHWRERTVCLNGKALVICFCRCKQRFFEHQSPLISSRECCTDAGILLESTSFALSIGIHDAPAIYLQNPHQIHTRATRDPPSTDSTESTEHLKLATLPTPAPPELD